jgi:hypothetical protein
MAPTKNFPTIRIAHGTSIFVMPPALVIDDKFNPGPMLPRYPTKAMIID